jgi:magnesium transporter
MTRGIITLSEKETLFDALELFALHRLLAIPVVNSGKKLLGVVEVSLYTEEVFDLAHHQQLNEVFQLIGLRLEQQKHGSAWKGFRARMPWLLSNITGGLICAALGAFFEGTVRQVVIIALFIPLILTLAESVSVQSMTLAIEEAMHQGSHDRGKSRGVFLRELLTALMLGACSGVVVGLVSLFWRDRVAATATIGVSVMLVMVFAATLGRVVPAVIHRLKLNPRIASGPITLAVVDVVAITVYLSAAAVILR